MTRKLKDDFVETDWARSAPKWQFWNKQQVKTISCTKCEWSRTMRRIHRSAMSAHLSTWNLSMSLLFHAEEHAKKKAKKS